jgi:hypothetical protein
VGTSSDWKISIPHVKPNLELGGTTKGEETYKLQMGVSNQTQGKWGNGSLQGEICCQGVFFKHKGSILIKTYALMVKFVSIRTI